jgi:hypothetical protein
MIQFQKLTAENMRSSVYAEISLRELSSLMFSAVQKNQTVPLAENRALTK